MIKKILITGLLSLLWSACVSEPVPMENDNYTSQETPSWISQLPEESNSYYLGISGSNTGDQAKDKEQAYQKALNALASSISTSIQSQSQILETETNEEDQFLYSNNIETQVSQNLQDVETVDSFYSTETGYWFYLRLSKERWEELVKQRAEDLKEQLSDMFFETFRDSYGELKTIDRAMKSYYKAYSGSPIKMVLLDARGSVDNILLLRADKLLSEMTIQWSPLPEVIQQNDEITLKGQIQLSSQGGAPASYSNPGPLPMVLSDSKGQSLIEFETQPDGSFEIQYQIKGGIGQQQYNLTLNEPFDAQGLGNQMDYRFPKASQQTEVKALNIGFILESNWENYGQYESVFQTMENKSDIALSSEIPRGASVYLKGDLSYRQAPPNDWDMIFSYVRFYLSRVSENGETVLWESDEVKEAGLTIEQANQNALDSLMEELKANQELSDILSESP